MIALLRPDDEERVRRGDPIAGKTGEELVESVVELLQLLDIVRLTRTIVVNVPVPVCSGEAIAIRVDLHRPMWRVDVGVDDGDASLEHIGEVAQRVLRRNAEAREAWRQVAGREVIDD